MQISIRYALLQIPGLMVLGVVLWAIWQWGWISGTWVLVVLALWIMKDVLMYPWFRSAMDHRAPDPGPAGMIGSRGRCRTRIGASGKKGTVDIGGEYWQAIAADDRPISPGSRIEVVDAEDMILQVRTRDEPSDQK